MRIECTYYADDGTEFENEEDCRKYEEGLKVSLDSIIFFSTNFSTVTNPEEISSYAIYAYIVNAEEAQKAFAFLAEYSSEIMPDIPYKNTDILMWDESDECWINLTMKEAEIKESIAKIRSLSRKKGKK